MIEFSQIMSSLYLSKEGVRKRSYPSDVWTMDTMMDAVREIGKSYDPRFVIDEDNRVLYSNLILWVMGDPRMTCIDPITGEEMKGRLDKGIYLAGNTGSGKTVAMKILRKLYELNLYHTVEDDRTVLWRESRSDEITEQFAFNGDLNIFKKAQMLSIQDLGSEPSETVYMGNRMNVLRNVLEYRGDRSGFVTMVTSNIPLGHPDLRARYGERATSRMMEMMNYLKLTGKDRRLNYGNNE